VVDQGPGGVIASLTFLWSSLGVKSAEPSEILTGVYDWYWQKSYACASSGQLLREYLYVSQKLYCVGTDGNNVFVTTY